MVTTVSPALSPASVLAFRATQVRSSSLECLPVQPSTPWGHSGETKGAAGAGEARPPEREAAPPRGAVCTWGLTRPLADRPDLRAGAGLGSLPWFPWQSRNKSPAAPVFFPSPAERTYGWPRRFRAPKQTSIKKKETEAVTDKRGRNSLPPAGQNPAVWLPVRVLHTVVPALLIPSLLFPLVTYSA